MTDYETVTNFLDLLKVKRKVISLKPNHLMIIVKKIKFTVIFDASTKEMIGYSFDVPFDKY